MPPQQNREVLRLAPQEWLFLGLVVLGWAIFVISLGKDMSWDFRNYHWYIPYAFLNGRMSLDISVAHQATFYNPALDIPFYLLATHAPSWVALGTLGAVQGANVVPLYLMARSILTTPQRKLVAAIVALFCMTGGLTLSLSGTTYYDTVMSVFVLCGLALVIAQRETLRDGTLARGALIAGAAGLLVGTAVALKLPEAPFALGFAATLLILPGDLRHRATRFFAGALGGAIGIALFAGFWYVKMAHLTGNPLFPYFNQVFHSPLALTASYRDERFLPHSLYDALILPFLFSIDWHVADDLPFQDIRVGLAYVFVILALPVWLFAKRPRESLVASDAAAALFGFAAVSYVAWIAIFAIYRYIVLLEMLGPLLVVAAIGLWPVSVRARFITAAVMLLFAGLTMRTGILKRAPLGDPYIQVTMPPIVDPDHAMVLMTGEGPLGFLAPSIPHQVPIIRIDGWMIQPNDGSRLTAEARRRVGAFKGDLYAIFGTYELPRSTDALSQYGLAVKLSECGDIVTNLGEDYRFCPLIRIAKP
ncbi:MAG TPA: hypothetical protein VN932_02685 [Rhizomicrobium sp.]|nr:hypothetical protein [Rhizomicrobium sp.]